MNPKYPIYIPSKNRSDSRLTMKALDEMNVPYRVAVEPSQYDAYASVIDKSKLLLLPRDDMKLIGSRNWIKEHSIKEGHAKHWQFDDNIHCFLRCNRNTKIKVASGTIFRCMEDFCDRYDNIAFAGPNYDFFVKARVQNPAFTLNTRIYSCTLVDNKCTILFYAFLQGKAETMSVKGGNTEELYTIENGRLKMAQALVALHPDVTKITYKFGKWQHQVDYTSFWHNKLILKKDAVITESINNYGMVLKEFK